MKKGTKFIWNPDDVIYGESTIFDRIYHQMSAAAAIGRQFTPRGQQIWLYILSRRSRGNHHE